MLNRRQLESFSNFFHKTFGHIKNTLYFCTRKSDGTTEISLVKAKREEIIEIRYNNQVRKKNQSEVKL